jgi:hypothetical protein
MNSYISSLSIIGVEDLVHPYKLGIVPKDIILAFGSAAL